MMLQVTELAPGSPVAPPPQQSVSLWQRSPATRQPLAGTQMWPPVRVGAHTWLQHVLHPVHGSPSKPQLPPPPPLTAVQVPTFSPMGMVHNPLQQSLLA